MVSLPKFLKFHEYNRILQEYELLLQEQYAAEICRERTFIVQKIQSNTHQNINYRKFKGTDHVRIY